MELYFKYGKSFYPDILKKYNISENDSDEDINYASFEFLCEVLGNSSFFVEAETKGSEDEGFTYLFPRKRFVSEHGRIITGIVMPQWWPNAMDGTHETNIFSNSVQELVDLIVKAFSEYYGLEIHSKLFFWDKDVTLLISDSSEEINESYDWLKNVYRQSKLESEKRKSKERKQLN